MRADLLTYLTKRYYKDHKIETEPGPVITISRQYGCPAKSIAKKLADKLTDKMIVKGISHEWKWVSKEILTQAAKELNVEPERIKYVFDYEQRSIIDDLLASQAEKYYKSDRRIRNTMARVIRTFSEDGHVIIIGRGGIALTRDIPKSLHINLEASLEWRALRIGEKHAMSYEAAIRCARNVDKKRKEFREFFEGRGSDYTRFDISINSMTFSTDEIVSTIVKIAEIRKLI